MTIEEKAKAYDEALGWMREMYPCLTDSLREDAERYFPELRESEDEKIRKELVAFFADDVRGYYWHDLDVADILAWLEKHKESLHISETCEENPDSFTDSIVEVRSFQKGIEVGREQEREKQKEQKPADWSEEDRDRVAQYLHDRDGGMLWSKATEITSDILDILRPRPSWKPSEEEMKALLSCTDRRVLAELYEHLQKLM